MQLKEVPSVKKWLADKFLRSLRVKSLILPEWSIMAKLCLVCVCVCVCVYIYIYIYIYIRGAFNEFPDFFVQAFKIVVDS